MEAYKEWTVDGFDLRATIEPDDNPDFSWIGTYTKTPDEATTGIVRHGKGIAVPNVVTRDGYLLGNVPHYFRPQKGCKEYWRQDDARLRAYYKEEWSMVGIVVVASKCGVELGRASVWSVEDDSGDDYMQQTAEELGQEAVEQARKKLAELCGDEADIGG